MTVQEGEKAPDFSLPTNNDGIFTLSEQKAKAVALFCYPKDDTSGCTKEAIGFSELKSEFDALDVLVVGISPDPAKKHDKFIAKHELTVPLIADEEKTALQALGVWVEKSMYGKKYMGVERSTFLIDANGTIVKAWRKVKVPGHVDEVLAAAKEL